MEESKDQYAAEGQNSVDSSIGLFSGISTRVAGGIVAFLTAAVALYSSLFSPEVNLVRLLGWLVACVGGIALLAAIIVLARTHRVPRRIGEGSDSQLFYPAAQRRTAWRRILPFSVALILFSFVLLLVDRDLTPRISKVKLSDSDVGILVIEGNSFGDNQDGVKIHFDGVDSRQVSAMKVTKNVIEVLAPDKFSKGEIFVSRGPRSSSPVLFIAPSIEYETAVVGLVGLHDSPEQILNSQIEPYPAFPYYSDTSDDPSQWPPRVFRDRAEFFTKMKNAFSGVAGTEVASWILSSRAEKLSISGIDDSEKIFVERYANLRQFLWETHGNYSRISASVGPHAAMALRSLEGTRRNLVDDIPNRLFIMRIRNASEQNVDGMNVEFHIFGAVYDVTVNGKEDRVRNVESSPDRFDVDIPSIRPGYTEDVMVWYQYLPIEQRVFPDAMDDQAEATQGVVVENIGFSNGRIRRATDLLGDLKPYQPYPLDPVQTSPAFGAVPQFTRPKGS